MCDIKHRLFFARPRLFVLALADQTSALSQHRCAEKASLDQGPAGSIHLTLPGRFNGAKVVDDDQTRGSLPVWACSWNMVVPPGRTVLLTLLRLEPGSAVWVRCVWNQEDHILESQGTVALSQCDQNKATLSWRADGGSADSIQLSYRGRKPPQLAL